MSFIPYFIVDAFITNKPYSGNPAAVCLLDNQLSDDKMLGIAKEFNFSETSFVKVGSGPPFSLRLFKPTHEVRICGHAILATAHILFKQYFPTEQLIRFSTKYGPIQVSRDNQELALRFEVQELETINTPQEIADWLNIKPLTCSKGIDRLIFCIDSVSTIRNFTLNLNTCPNLQKPIIIITAKTGLDSYCYRYFTPLEARIEDPATGTAQMFLAPFWATRLNNNTLHSKQLSKRGGTFKTVVKGDLVDISGRCSIFSKGRIL